ncbi:MAG: GxxExxY protein [Bacteroidetes bacterium]|nr:MAG: GxxExxY protein [Bacteroidota bacterium]
MYENELSATILDIAFEIHKTLGPGLFESVYESILEFELTESAGLFVERQKPMEVNWRDTILDLGFRCDLIVERSVIIEVKSVEKTQPVHYKQLLTYLRLANVKLGLLINFNEVLLKDGIRRVANGL